MVFKDGEGGKCWHNDIFRVNSCKGEVVETAEVRGRFHGAPCGRTCATAVAAAGVAQREEVQGPVCV